MPTFKRYKYAAWADLAVEQHEADRPSVLAVDTETSGLGFYDEPFGATVTWDRDEGDPVSFYFELPEALPQLRQILTATPVWVGHNLKFDLQKLLLVGAINYDLIALTDLHDTQTIYHLLDENGRKGLKHLAVKVLGYDDTIEVEVKSGPNKGQKKKVPKEQHQLNLVRRKLGLTKDDGYHLLPRQVLVPYALRDTEFTLALFDKLWPRLLKKDDNLVHLYQQSMELAVVLLRMEEEGFRLDLPYLEQTTSDYGVEVMKAWNAVVSLTGNPELNPQSPAQLTEAFAKRGIRLTTTEAAELKKLDDDLARAILHYREVKKLHTTYLKGLLSEQRGGLIHPNFNPDGARTGRMSSGAAKE